MTKLITAFAFFVISLLSAQGQHINHDSTIGKFGQGKGEAIELFATFKPETPFSPKWGLDRALEAQKNCKQ